MCCHVPDRSFFFFNDTATTEIYTLSLHDALPICVHDGARDRRGAAARSRGGCPRLPGETDQPARGPREDQALGREVTSRQFLLIVAIAQGALLVALVILIILNRWVRVRRRAQIHPRRIELDGLMQR